jgi:hypothetical protein
MRASRKNYVGPKTIVSIAPGTWRPIWYLGCTRTLNGKQDETSTQDILKTRTPELQLRGGFAVIEGHPGPSRPSRTCLDTEATPNIGLSPRRKVSGARVITSLTVVF